MTDSAIDAVRRARYIRLTTFRRDGTPVATPVWLAHDGDDVVVSTAPDSGKAKRLRHTSRVLVAPSNARGVPLADVVEVEGTAELVTEPSEAARLHQLVVDRYGWQYRVATLLYRLRGHDLRDDIGIRVRIRL